MKLIELTKNLKQQENSFSEGNILYPFVVAEQAVSKKTNEINIVDEKLNKRRGQYSFDLYLQNGVLSSKLPNSITRTIPCGTSGYYKSEIEFDNSVFLHYQHSFDRSAKYNSRYLAMNSDKNKPKYAFFLYGIDEEKCNITLLKFIIPSMNDGINIAEIDITSVYYEVKSLFDENNQSRKGIK